MEKIMADKLIRLEPGGKFCFKKKKTGYKMLWRMSSMGFEYKINPVRFNKFSTTKYSLFHLSARWNWEMLFVIYHIYEH